MSKPKKSKIQKTSYTQNISDSRLLDLSKECGKIYSKALVFFNRVWFKKGIWLSEKSVRRYIESICKRENLHSQSYQAAYQQLFKNHSSWREALEEYKKHPEKFNSKPKIPYKRKYLQPVQFKKGAIRIEDGYLLLSLARGLSPIKIRWSLSMPSFALICWKRGIGWQLSCVMNNLPRVQELDKKKTVSIDLGVKRIAATFDGEDCITYSGKMIKSLVRLENKVKAKTSSRLSKLKKGSRKWKKLRKAERRVKRRIKNKMGDILHKTSRTIVNETAIKGAGKIIIGDCSGIHKDTNCGKKNNQQIQQNPEQKLKGYIDYKFKGIGGTTAVVSEKYTTQTCPECGKRYKPSGRVYKCSRCGFLYDRDGVGAINIYFEKVSSDNRLDVVGGLTPPRGWQYKPQLLCLVGSIRTRRTPRL